MMDPSLIRHTSALPWSVCSGRSSGASCCRATAWLVWGGESQTKAKLLKKESWSKQVQLKCHLVQHERPRLAHPVSPSLLLLAGVPVRADRRRQDHAGLVYAHVQPCLRRHPLESQGHHLGLERAVLQCLAHDPRVDQDVRRRDVAVGWVCLKETCGEAGYVVDLR